MFAITKEALAPALEVVRSALLKRSDLPIHSHVLMEVRQGQLRLATNSQVLHAQIHLAATGGDAAVAVPGEITEIVERLNGTISFEKKEGTVTIKAGGTRLRLPCLNADGFPEMTIESVKTEVEVPAIDLLRALQFVEPAVAKQDPRLYFTGVLFQWKGASLTVVGSDGYIMGIARMASGASIDADCILPQKAVNEVIRLIRLCNIERVKIAVGEQLVRFQIGACEIRSKIVDAKYPKWESIVSGAAKGTTSHQISIDRTALSDSLERISLIAKDQKRFLFQFEPGKVVLTTSNGAQSAEEPVAAETTTSGQLWLNKSQMQIALSRIAGAFVTMNIGDAHKSIRLAGECRTECYIVMPMKE